MAQTKTSRGEGFVDKGKKAAKQAAVHPWVETVMRLGYVVRGIIYGLVGLLAVQVAFAGRGVITDPQGAISRLGSLPFGKFILILIVPGLVGYGLWGFVRAFLDPLHKGKDPKGLVTRAGYLISGISYAALVLPTVRSIMNAPGGAAAGAQTSSGQQAVGSILTTPWGPWVVGLIGAGIVAAGVIQIVQGWRANFDMRFDAYALDAQKRRAATRLGRFGYIARGIVFAIVGVFLIQAAFFNDPGRFRGIEGALFELSKQPYGTLLLAVAAIGLIAFGIYSIVGGLWFRFQKR